MSRARLDTVENHGYGWRARAETGVFASFERHVGQFCAGTTALPREDAHTHT
jgi:hypothetical protein